MGVVVVVVVFWYFLLDYWATSYQKFLCGNCARLRFLPLFWCELIALFYNSNLDFVSCVRGFFFLKNKLCRASTSKSKDPIPLIAQW
jgi:hypothetical protein